MRLKISIIIVTYNAQKYIKHCVDTIRNINVGGCDYEIIVYDNNSNNKTKTLLSKLKDKGYIDKLILSEKNWFFVGGNNRGADYSSDDSELLLLLNPDVEIRNSEWLEKLVNIHKRGITALQVCSEKDNRPDGWCVLIDRDIFMEYKLDEERFVWFFSMSDLVARIMKDGYSVQTIRQYENFIHHFGGASEINTNIEKASRQSGLDVDEWLPYPCDVIDYIDFKQKGKRYYLFYLYDKFQKQKRKVKRRVCKM